ncbi:MAG: DUF1015 domain-containing protein [Actinobacteria bacterium]|nr:DUF1015 domain-containing protein [Actinomycetota bacterium]
MPDFQPFRGVRYDAGRFGTDLSAVVAPPYDVIDEDRLAALRASHPLNAVHLTLPEDSAPGDRYERAAQAWRDWLEQGVLRADDAAAFYLYRVDFTNEDGQQRQTTGVIGALTLVPPDGDGVLPHERTMPKPKGDRLDLLRATRVNLEPIWGLSLAGGLSELCEARGAPVATAVDTRGAIHQLFTLDAPGRTEAVAAAVASAPVVIADGHHRYETSLHYRQQVRSENAGSGPHDAIMMLVVELADDQLAVQPIHRLISGVSDPATLRATLADFDLRRIGPNEPDVIDEVAAVMAAEGAMALVDDEGVALISHAPDSLADALASEPEAVRGVDSALFESAIAPALAAAGADVRYRHDRHAVADLVAKGEVDAAVLLRPVDIATIRAVAQQRERMPQKTTFFHPKPSTGLVFRSLDV